MDLDIIVYNDRIVSVRAINKAADGTYVVIGKRD
jgi:hypothetical protein